MAIKWISYFIDESELQDSELLLAIIMADHSDNEGKSYPGVVTLARRLRKSVRHTQRLLAEIEAKGYVKIEHHSGRGNFTAFQLQKVTPASSIASEKGDADVIYYKSEKVTSSAEKGDAGVQEKVTPVSSPSYKEETLIETLIETVRERDALLSETEKVLGFVPDPLTQDRLMDVVPERFEAQWISLIKNRMLGSQGATRNLLLSRLGYWLSDFENNLWRYEKDLEVKNGSNKHNSSGGKPTSTDRLGEYPEVIDQYPTAAELRNRS